MSDELEFVAELTSEWRFTAPPEVRRALKLREGETVRVIVIKLDSDSQPDRLEFVGEITKHWRVTIPSSVRKALGLGKKELVRIVLIKLKEEEHAWTSY